MSNKQRHVPQEALQILRRNGKSAVGGEQLSGASIQLAKAQEDVERRIEPSVVSKGNWNPLSLESRFARKAREEAFNARLAVFLDNVRAVRAANQALNHAAVAEVLSAAETFLIEVRGLAEVEKQRILNEARRSLLDELDRSLEDLERYRGRLPEEVLQAMEDVIYRDFAERVQKVAGLDFEFDKSDLMRIDLSAFSS